MPSKTYAPAQPDAIGMADLDLDAPLADDDDGLTRGGGVKIRDHVALKPSPPPNTSFEPVFGDARTTRTKPHPRPDDPSPLSQPLNFAPGLPRDPRQLKIAKDKLNDLGNVYEPNQAAPQYPEIKTTAVDGAAPALGTMVTNIPSFAQEVYGTNAPKYEAADPLDTHGKDAHVAPTRINAPPPPIGGSRPAAAAPAPTSTTTTTRINAAPPALGSKLGTRAGNAAPPPRIVTPQPAALAPAPAPVVQAPAPAPVVQAPAPALAPAQTTTRTVAAAPAPAATPPPPPPPDIPKNAKKVVTTTTTTTKIVDGKEIVETHVHHDVVLKKKGFGMPKFLKNLGGKKKQTQTTTTVTTTTEGP